MKRLTPICVFGLALAGAAFAQDPAPEANPAPAGAQKPAATTEQEKEKPKVYEIGVQVPEELTLVDLDGKTLSMKELRGKVVVLTWYAYKCPAIKTAGPLLKKMAAEYGAKDSEVVFIGINSDKGELADAEPKGVDAKGKPIKAFAALRTAMEKRGVNFRIFVDRGNVVADLFLAKTTPHMYVLDAEGVVQYSGALDNDPRQRKDKKEYVNYVRDAVTALQAGKEVAVQTTKPYG